MRLVFSSLLLLLLSVVSTGSECADPECTAVPEAKMVSMYAGTSYPRIKAIHARVAKLVQTGDLNSDWNTVARLKLVWAGGMRDLSKGTIGRGYNGHAFNDFNHCDLTAMRLNVADNQHDGSVPGIARGNPLGEGIRIASLTVKEMEAEDSADYGSVDGEDSGSWSTCMMGCNTEPPNDVAHTQFKSRIAFKLVWVPPEYNSFVLVDDDGDLLATGTPTGQLPSIRERMGNYELTKGSKYAVEADKLSNDI